VEPVRRVVTGEDAQGRSKVAWDGPAPNSRRMDPANPSIVSDIWVWNESPAPLDGDTDDGNLKYEFPCPPGGGHVRVIRSAGRPEGYDPANDRKAIALHEPRAKPGGRTWDRGGSNAFTTDMHKTQSIDYAIALQGERVLGMDDGQYTIRPGDVIVQVGAWHQWIRPDTRGSTMLFDMFAAEFVDGAQGLAQGNDAVMTSNESGGIRRIVTIDQEAGKGSVIADGPSPDVRTDPARPGFSVARLWVTDSAPAKIVRETLHLPDSPEPPPRGSVLKVYTLPPEKHPHMRKTRTLDICAITEGEITLVLDAQAVTLSAGDVVVIRGNNHAWTNISDRMAKLAVCSHDGRRGR
jgi:quercetin dioxygenase-like cupin family protein